MPVVLTRDQFDLWLDPEVDEPKAILPLLQPCPDDWLTRTAVGAYVNSVRNQGPECVKPVPVQRGLF